ncbi:MAG: HAD family phosphatase [Proteobacteria bacterium]|nr:MAG: HAD family phosphatase [Pseudomonadota bacterium]
MILNIPDGRFAAYLFDCDGTIANSLPLHFEAWKQALAPWDASFPEELFYAWGGIPVPRTVEMLNDHLGISMEVNEVVEAREKAYFSLIESIKAHAEVEAVIRKMHGKVPMAVVSGSPRASVEKTLRQLGLWEFFDVIVGAEDVKMGKPNPEPFLTAARLLSVEPELCLVFEDAEPGVQSAIAAGMQFVRIPQRPE